MLDSFDINAPIGTLALTLLMVIPGGTFWTAAGLHAPSRDWTVLRPCGLRLVASAGAFAVSAIHLLRGGLLLAEGELHGGAAVIWRGLGALALALFFLYTAAVLLLVRFAFNDTGIRKVWFDRIRFVPWSEVARLERDLVCGVMLVLKSGERVGLASRLVGLGALAAEALRQGVAVAPALLATKAPKKSQRRLV